MQVQQNLYIQTRIPKKLYLHASLMTRNDTNKNIHLMIDILLFLDDSTIDVNKAHI